MPLASATASSGADSSAGARQIAGARWTRRRATTVVVSSQAADGHEAVAGQECRRWPGVSRRAGRPAVAAGRGTIVQLAGVDDEALGPGQLHGVLDAHGQALDERSPLSRSKLEIERRRDGNERGIGDQRAAARRSGPGRTAMAASARAAGSRPVAGALRIEERRVEAYRRARGVGDVEPVRRPRRPPALPPRRVARSRARGWPGRRRAARRRRPRRAGRRCAGRLGPTPQRALDAAPSTGMPRSAVPVTSLPPASADTPGHGVLGQVRVGELVDVVGLAVLPVLQELGGGPRVVDLVEVHA